MRTPVASGLKGIHTDVDVSGTLTGDHGVPMMPSTNSVSLLSTELSHCPASDHSRGCSDIQGGPASFGPFCVLGSLFSLCFGGIFSVL